MPGISGYAKEIKNHLAELYGTLDKGSTGKNMTHFAAFDPKKRNSTNILASALLGTALLKPKKEDR